MSASPSELIVYTPEYFRKERNIDVRTGARVVAISPPAPRGPTRIGPKFRYEHLVLATGARGATCSESAGRAAAARLHPSHAGRRRAHAPLPARAQAEAPRSSWAPDTSASRPPTRCAATACASPFWSARRTPSSRDDAAFTAAVRKQLERHGVELRTGVTVTAIEPDRVAGVPCDMVVMAAGFQAQRRARRGGRHRDRTHRRDSHRRAHGDQPPRSLRGRRLRRSHAPGHRPAHLDSARHDREQGRPCRGRLCRRRARALRRGSSARRS